MYTSEDNIPLYLYTKIKEDIEKPIVKLFIYIKKILKITPIIDIPSIQDNIISIIPSIKLFLKELRLLNITIKQNEQILFEGKTEDVPKDLKDKEYDKIYFEGVDVIVEI